MTVSVVSYGSDVRTVTRNDCKIVQAVDTKFLRSTAGYVLRDDNRNDDIRKEQIVFCVCIITSATFYTFTHIV